MMISHSWQGTLPPIAVQCQNVEKKTFSLPASVQITPCRMNVIILTPLSEHALLQMLAIWFGSSLSVFIQALLPLHSQRHLDRAFWSQSISSY